MPENYVQSIVERIAEVAKKSAQEASPVRIATVLSVNPDGSVNVDDGMGGCARVASVGTQAVQCGGTVVLGLEPTIGNTTDLCQVQFTINSSSKGCPVETRTDDTEVEVAPTAIFIDDEGNRYDGDTGAFLGTGTDYANQDHSYGYAPNNLPTLPPDPDTVWAGIEANDWQDVQIGTLSTNTGYQGETYHIANTTLCRGVGTSSGVLLGVELPNTADTPDEEWRLNLRDPSTFALLQPSTIASFIYDYMVAHSDIFPLFGGDHGASYDVSICADPSDGTFWVNLGHNSNAPGAFLVPVFNVSPVNASLIRTVELEYPGSSFILVNRILV